MKTTPKITFVSDKNTSLDRLKFTFNQIKSGFYEKHGFIITTSKPTCAKYNNTVYISEPIVNYLSKYRKTNKAKLFYKSDPQLKQLLEIATPQNVREKIVKEFVDDLEKIFGDKVEKINIFCSPYGTRSSIRYKETTNSQINIIIRDDIYYRALFGTILYKYIISHANKRDLNYLNRTSEFLLTKTSLKKYEKYYLKTKNKTRKVKLLKPCTSKSLIQKSNEIYRNLGYPLSPVLNVKNDTIYYSNTKVSNTLFSKLESKVLKLIIPKSPNVVTYDEIGNVLWGDNLDKFSLEAINKTLERISKKIKMLGITKEVIFNKRGEGYFFS